MTPFLHRTLLNAALGIVVTLVFVACGAGNKITDCQNRGYAQLQKEYGGEPPQEAVNAMTRRCVERYQAK